MISTKPTWQERLAQNQPGRDTAVAELRLILLNGLRAALSGRADVSGAHLEDFVQDALVKILARLDDFKGRSKFTTWAHSIAINTALTELRRKRWQDVSLETLLADGRELGSPDSIPVGLFEGDENRERISALLKKTIVEKLSDKQRAIITGLLQEMPFDQIVALLGTNRNAGYKLLHDARRALKQHLAAAGITAEKIRQAFEP